MVSFLHDLLLPISFWCTRGKYRTLPQELSGSSAQETLTHWTQLMWDRIRLSCFTPSKVWDGITCSARQHFRKSGYFSNPADDRGNKNSECEPVPYACIGGTSAFGWKLLRLGIGSRFFPTGIMTFQQLVNVQFTSKYGDGFCKLQRFTNECGILCQ